MLPVALAKEGRVRDALSGVKPPPPGRRLGEGLCPRKYKRAPISAGLSCAGTVVAGALRLFCRPAASDDAFPKQRSGQFHRDLGGLVAVVEDRVDLDDVERGQTPAVRNDLHEQLGFAVGEPAG